MKMSVPGLNSVVFRFIAYVPPPPPDPPFARGGKQCASDPIFPPCEGGVGGVFFSRGLRVRKPSETAVGGGAHRAD